MMRHGAARHDCRQRGDGKRQQRDDEKAAGADGKAADGFAKGWVFQQGRPGLTNTDFGTHATVTELAAEDCAELTRAPEREPEILMERTP